MLLLALVSLGVATGCNSYLVDEGDPGAPVLVQGRVVDASGGGMSGARVVVRVRDDGGAEAGSAGPIVYEGEFSAGLDGTFIARVAPSAALVRHAAENGGVVEVDLVVFAGAAPFAFPRAMQNGTWTGQVPTFVFGPDGVTVPSAAPAPPGSASPASAPSATASAGG